MLMCLPANPDMDASDLRCHVDTPIGIRLMTRLVQDCHNGLKSVATRLRLNVLRT